MSNYLDAVIVEHNPSQKKIDRAVIWLHGLGASGHDFEPWRYVLSFLMPPIAQ